MNGLSPINQVKGAIKAVNAERSKIYGAAKRGLFCLIWAVFLFLPSLAWAEVGLKLSLSCPYWPAVRYYQAESFPGLSIVYQSPALLSYKSLPLRRSFTVELQKGNIYLEETIASHQFSHPLLMDLPLYLSLIQENNLWESWRESERLELTKEEREKTGGFLQYELPLKMPKFITSIIGEGGPALRVNGTRRISFSGRSEWTEGEAATATHHPSKFPALKMEQKSRFTITGTIGSKIKVSIDQDSERETDLENRIHLSYQGDEDEIVQNVEAGNTTLSLGGTQFVGYRGHAKGLFGIKAQAKIGHLNLTAITSQEKSSADQASFTAKGAEGESIIYDKNYLQNTYYWLGLARGDTIRDYKIFVDNGAITSEEIKKKRPGRAYFDPDTSSTFEEGHFELIDPSQGEYFVDKNDGWIMFEQALGENYIFGVWYTTTKGDTIGKVSSNQDDTLILKLIKPKSPNPNDPTWVYEWRNVYSLGARNIDPDGFEVQIYRDLSSGIDPTTQDSIPYLELFGLDRVDQDGNPIPDGKIDISTRILDLGRGHLVFPDPYPFWYGWRDSLFHPIIAPLRDSIPQIYTTSHNRLKDISSKYYMKVKYAQRKAEYSLGHINIIPGSEVVTLNGRRLQKGKDYNISYEIGQITFLTKEALDPNANLEVHYEYAPFMQIEKKSLLGLKAEYKKSEHFKIGALALYRSQSTPEERPRVGQEPVRDFIWDMNASLNLNPPLMTEMVDALPFIQTDAKSSLSLSGEVAQVIPNPNTKNEALIDDFEGSREYLDLGIIRTIWTKSSPPVGTPDSLRGKLIWYNPWGRYPVKYIWPNKETTRQESEINILTLKFDTAPPDSSYWGGVMRALPLSYRDQTETKYLEIWAQGDKGKLVIDLGQISEDINGNGELDTEDKNQDGILDEDEDVGLDGCSDPYEDGKGGCCAAGDSPHAHGIEDPNGDNWSYNYKSDNYSQINGTEGNKDDPDAGRRPDTEDLNGNLSLDRKNSYFEYVIDLSDASSPYEVPDSRNEYGWRLYRVPLQDSLNYKEVGNPNWLYIDYVRMWLTGTTSEATLRIATIQLVGNKWRELGITPKDSLSQEKFDIATINTEENSKVYTPPPGVKGKLDRQTHIRAKEQSLILKYENLQPGHTGRGYRLLYSKENYTNYRTLKMFVHGPDSLPYPFFLFRLGSDSLNFYEYHTLLRPGWDPENEVVIDFDEITALKNYMLLNGLRDTTDGPYRVRGAPTLTAIKWFEVGVTNVDSLWPMSGEVWIDELRVTRVKREPGWAKKVSLSAQFADLFHLSASYQNKDSRFHGLGGSRPGYSITSQSLSISNFALHKFFPKSWGINLPLNGSWSKSLTLPELKSGTDIFLPEELRREERTEKVTRSASADFSINRKGDNPLFNLFLNRMSTHFGWGDDHTTSPTTPTNWNDQYNLSWGYSLSPEHKSLSPFGWAKSKLVPRFIYGAKLFYLPTSLNLSAAVSRTKGLRVDNSGTRTETYTRNFTGSASTGFSPFQSLQASYSVTTNRDIRRDEEINLSYNPKRFSLGRETAWTENGSVTFQPTLLKFLTQRYAYQANYRESFNPQSYGREERTANLDLSGSASLSLRINGFFNFIKPPENPRRLRKGSPRWILLQFKELWSSIDPLSGSYHRDRNLLRHGLLGRPSFTYRMGITQDPGVEINTRSVGFTRDSETESESWDLSSGFSPLKPVKVHISYKRGNRINRDPSSPTESRSETFPDLTLRWNSVERFPILNLFASSANLSAGYTRKVDFSGPEGLDTLYSKNTSFSYSPLFSLRLTWKNGISSTLEGTRSVNEKRAYQGAANTTRTEDRTYKASFSKSFRAPHGVKLPILRKKIRFESSLNISVDITVKSSKNENITPDGRRDLLANTKDWSISAHGSYTFSRQITGGMNISISDNNDLKRGTKRKVREIGFWMEMKF